MPKKALSINSFSGLNTQSDARDLKLGELSKADDVLVDKRGRIRTRIGITQSGSLDQAITYPIAGYGLFQFSSDYTWASPPGRVEATTDYLVLQDGKDFLINNAYETGNTWQTTDTDGTALTIGTTETNVKPCYYYVDGALRVCDGYFANTANTAHWLGRIKHTHLDGATSYDRAIDDWLINDSNIVAPTSGHSYSSSFLPTATTGFNLFVATPTGGSFPSGTWEFGFTFIYDNNQESLIYNTKDDIETLDGDVMNIEVLALGDFNDRMTGFGIYIRANDTDDDWILLKKVDILSGWADDATVNSATKTLDTISGLPTTSYEMSTGLSQDEEIIDAKYKTACIVNRRCYIGNIYQDSVHYSDRMLKSPVNNFDIFPASNYVDVAINDGEDIVSLIAFADRILQFKRNTLYIVNVSGDYEYLEAEHINKGIEYPYQVVKTSIGVVWCNQYGIFLYDGKQIIEISLSIADAYKSFYISNTSIGYDEPSRKLMVLQSNITGVGDDDGYFLDIDTKTFTKFNDIGLALGAGEALSNFTTGAEGELLIYQDDSGTNDYVYEISNSSQAISTFDIKTNDIDFGDAGVRKRIYGVYVTYKAASISNIKARLVSNGGVTATNLYTGKALPSTSGNWDNLWLPATSIFNSDSVIVNFYADGTVPKGFEINDLTIIYRELGAR